ncbi:MAG: helix-turn-helix domain-containing protein [Clostridia bacterium]|nr:helix-turn-helix domain-containing protein [Clostridia bacterium]
MLRYNLNQVNKLLGSLSTFSEVEISFYDKNFEPTNLNGIHTNTERVCGKLKETLRNKCRQSDLIALTHLTENPEETFFYSYCHFGFVNIVCKIGSNEQPLGYAMIGPFREHKRKREDLERLQAYCTTHDVNFEEIKDAYLKMPVFSSTKSEALKSLLFSLFDYAEIKNFISVKDTMFSTDIEPYIASHLHEKLSIEYLCEYFHVSQKMLYTLFQKNVGTTPKHYINRCRVEKAKQLISTTDMPLSEIASNVGIHDYNYFVKIFKAYAGSTPTFYKKR